MPHASEAALVFADLGDALKELEIARASPRDVRRAFSRFVELAQKVTSAMRRDFSRLGKGKWHASSFKEWTPITELMKYLRNEDQHGDQIYISVHERRHYPVPANLPPGFHSEPGRTFVFEGTWDLHDQLLDVPPDGIESFEVDPLTGQPTGREMQLLKLERLYLLQARSEEARAKLIAAGTRDVHALAEAAFSTLTVYFQFFREQSET